MSTKRAATTELNHENWDQDDPADHEEMGVFKTAPKDILEKRVIRTAKRRSQATSEEGRGVFSGFGGFNKTQPSSFDFLANLTNGNKTSPGSKDTAVTSSLFTNKTFGNNTGGPIFGSEVTSAIATKSSFGFPAQSSSPLFGASLTSTQTSTSIFTASKADSTVDDPSKIQNITSTTEPTSTLFTNSASVTGSIMSPTLFGVSSSNTTASKTLISTTNTSTPFKIQPVSSSTTTQNTFGISTESKPSVTEGSSNEDKKLKYYSKLKGLNESVSEWIKKHVEETPLCILTPIFKDYEKYLKEMQEEYHGGNENNKDKITEPEITPAKSDVSNDNKIKGVSIFSSNTNASPTTKSDSEKTSNSDTPTSSNFKDKSTFSFGVKASEAANPTPSAGFSFGVSTPFSSTRTSSLFSTAPNNNSNGSTPFSFGGGKPFSFNSNIKKPETEATDSNTNEEDEPPKVEFIPVVEENSVYDKKCKIFFKKDGTFVDKGVATLYIKKVEDSGKHQLLVRANTNLGTILLNMILVSAIPTQRTGKNNVMMVCIPTPDSKPPPIPILIRVKTSEEADELLETLNKYKT